MSENSMNDFGKVFNSTNFVNPFHTTGPFLYQIFSRGIAKVQWYEMSKGKIVTKIMVILPA